MVQVPSCPLCYGRRPFCIHKSYPLQGLEIQEKVREKLRKDFYGPSYSIFVGRENYPDVFAGPMLGLEAGQEIDSPQNWFGMEYAKIIELRSFLLRSKSLENIRSESRFVREMQELALASRPTEVEMNFRRTPVFELRLSESFQPMGPSGLLEKMRVTENVKIKGGVEKIISDELKAGEQAFLLYQQGLDVYKITSVFSSGALGMEKNKKLVPSRWSTTGTHSIIADYLIKEIKQFSSINEYRVYSSQFLDNHFEILLMPGKWEFENFEAWAPGSNWAVPTQSKIIGEYEPYEGRTTYADSQAGGFYASRLGCTEGLKGIGKQSRLVVFREVYEGYSVPVGVWQVLENVRNAFRQPYRKFNTKQEALTYLESRLRIPIEKYKKCSKILSQKKLFDYAP